MSSPDPSTPPFPDEHRWERTIAEHRGGPGYAELVAAQRLVQDRVAGMAPPVDLVPQITAKLQEVAELLAPWSVPEPERWDGWRPDIPGRGMPLLPPYVVDSHDESHVAGRVTFTRFFLGGNGAVHGGSHTLLFDDLMGHLAGRAGGICRTAYLTINYRRITPLDVELHFDVRLDSVDGRKRFVSARLFNPAGEVAADCAGLFLRLLPGQQ